MAKATMEMIRIFRRNRNNTNMANIAPESPRSIIWSIFLFITSVASSSTSMRTPLDSNSPFRRSISCRTFSERSITLANGDLDKIQEITSFPLVRAYDSSSFTPNWMSAMSFNWIGPSATTILPKSSVARYSAVTLTK